ncbi:MAG: hypothetical protein AAF597_20900, partial [Bacteroidota bacterium]
AELKANLRLLDSTLLVIDSTGFRLGDGTMNLSATYAIEQDTQSPFTLQWNSADLSLSALLKTIHQLGHGDLLAANRLGGKLNTQGDFRGVLTNLENRLPLAYTTGQLRIGLDSGSIAQLPILDELGRKLHMRKRFREVSLGPLAIDLYVDEGRLVLPRTEVQSTTLHFFVEGVLDTITGPDLLIALPLKNIGRGVKALPPAKTGFALAGKKVYIVLEQDEQGAIQTKFRLGRRKYFRQRGRLADLKQLKQQERAERRLARRQRRN